MNGKTVKTLRKRLGVTQADLAKKLGTTRVTVSRWEAGIREPSRIVLNALKWLLEITSKDKKGVKHG